MKIRQLALFFVLLPSLLLAAPKDNPVGNLRSVSQQVLIALKSHQSELASNNKIVFNIINRYLLPHFTIDTMVQGVIGRNVWKNSTPSQRQQFTEQFTQLVIRTYASAFSTYNQQDVVFSPLRRENLARSVVEVKSKITQPGSPDIAVTYQMKKINGNWKIFDFSVDNISMISSFRAQFSDEINQNGMQGMIARLKEHNLNTKS